MDQDCSNNRTSQPSTSAVDNLTSDIIKDIVLFTWDNILGPKTLHIWTGPSQLFLTESSDEACASSYVNIASAVQLQQQPTLESDEDAKQKTVANLLEKLSDTAGMLFQAGFGRDTCSSGSATYKPNDSFEESYGESVEEDGADPYGVYSSELSSTSATGSTFEPLITADLLEFSARLILNGEICKDWDSGNVDRKIVNLPDRDVVISAYTFAVGSSTGLTIHSLALFIPSEEMQAFLSLQRLVSSWMERLSRKLGVILEKSSTSIATDAFTPSLEDFSLMLTSLQEAGLPAKINLIDTIFTSCERLHQDKKYYNFVRQSITSHLMTCGRSLVIGEDPRGINKLIASLAMFNTESERKSSRFVVQDRLWPYHHDLCLQGLLKQNSHEVDMPTEEIYCSEFPTTVIDLTNLEVRQSLPCHEHNFRKFEICKQEIVNLYTGKSQGYKLRTSEMFFIAEAAESMVDKLLGEICFLPSEDSVVQAYIDHFMLLLQRKAVTFASFIEKETNEGRHPLKASLKVIREHLGLTLDGDFHMVLACAEKLNFGLYAYLFGDPKEKNDEMRRIIDSF